MKSGSNIDRTGNNVRDAETIHIHQVFHSGSLGNLSVRQLPWNWRWRPKWCEQGRRQGQRKGSHSVLFVVITTGETKKPIGRHSPVSQCALRISAPCRIVVPCARVRKQQRKDHATVIFPVGQACFHAASAATTCHFLLPCSYMECGTTSAPIRLPVSHGFPYTSGIYICTLRIDYRVAVMW